MKQYAAKRLLQLIPLLFGITFLSFAMMRLAGSDPILQQMERTGIILSQEVIEEERERMGLNQPFLVQYGSWLMGVLRGDMGTSYMSGQDVFSTFLSKLPATLLLTASMTQIMATVMTVRGRSSRIMLARLVTMVTRELMSCGMLWLMSWRRVSTSLV